MQGKVVFCGRIGSAGCKSVLLCELSNVCQRFEADNLTQGGMLAAAVWSVESSDMAQDGATIYGQLLESLLTTGFKYEKSFSVNKIISITLILTVSKLTYHMWYPYSCSRDYTCGYWLQPIMH